MQLTFSHDQISNMRDLLQLLILPFIGWLVRSSRNKIKHALNQVITENANRIKMELEVYIDAKILNHENMAFEKIDKIERFMNPSKSSCPLDDQTVRESMGFHKP